MLKLCFEVPTACDFGFLFYKSACRIRKMKIFCFHFKTNKKVQKKTDTNKSWCRNQTTIWTFVIKTNKMRNISSPCSNNFCFAKSKIKFLFKKKKKFFVDLLMMKLVDEGFQPKTCKTKKKPKYAILVGFDPFEPEFRTTNL